MNDTAGGSVAAAVTLAQLVRAAARAYGDAPAVTLATEDGEHEAASFAELDARSALLARGLVARGVGKGARVGFIVGNGPRFAVALAAIGRIGAVAVPISTMIRADELVRVLRQSDVAGLIVQRTLLGHDLVARLAQALPALAEGGPELRVGRVPFLRWVVSDGDGLPGWCHGAEYLDGAAASVSEQLLAEVESEVHATDQMIEIYTSGSMALPKGVRHNHGPAMFRAHYLGRMIGRREGEEVGCQLPMFWVGGLMMSLLPNWVTGSITACTDRTLRDSRVAMGSVLAAEDIAQMVGAKPWWGLGMSETLGPYSYGDDFRDPAYPLCAPMDHFAERYEARIADARNRPVADGEVGEMQLRGYPVTSALHKIERAEHFTPDGYYRTGDMCLVRGARALFVGRDGDMIKTAGSNVSPAEVEMELQTLDGVHSAYVVGLPDRERGQLVVAAVVPREGAELDFAAIEAELRRRLSAYKVPRAYVPFTHEEVPMLHSNKVARRQIAAILAERLGRVVDVSGHVAAQPAT